MSYSITIVGFVGADPERRQARNDGSKFTVLSVATQRSWKNAEDEWVSKVEWHRVAIFRPRLAEAVLSNIKKGAHVLVEGSLVSSTYEQANGKGKKAKAASSSASPTTFGAWKVGGFCSVAADAPWAQRWPFGAEITEPLQPARGLRLRFGKAQGSQAA